MSLFSHKKSRKTNGQTTSNNCSGKNDDHLPVESQNRVKMSTQMDIKSVESLAKALKNRKAPGVDELHNEMIKYGRRDLHTELTKLFQKVLTDGNVPSDWKRSITIPIFKKGDKKRPENYRGVTLLSAAMTLFTRILTNKISGRIPMERRAARF